MTNSNEQKSKIKDNQRLPLRKRKMMQQRQTILEAAKELFEHYPYEDVTMADIAERAVLSRATLYNRFDSKEAIYFEIGIQGMRTIYLELQTVIASESTGLDKTTKLCELYLQNLFKHPLNHQIMRHYLVAVSNADIDPEESLRKLMSEEEQDSSEKIRARYLREVITSEKVWKNAIEVGFEDRSIRDDLTANQLVHFLHMIISGIVDRVNLERIPLQKVNLSVERIITRTIDLIRNDLAKN